MSRRKSLALLVTIAGAGALMSAAVACGSNNGNAKPTATESISGTPTEAGQTPSQTSPQGGAVSLEETEFAITGAAGAAIPNVTAGSATFEVKNNGTIAHDLVIIQTETDEASLPTDGTKVNEETAGTIVGRLTNITAGASGSGSFKLAAGNYVLICNVAGHYAQGMHAALVVQ
jgi:uncharacterized cupredoxin-like copper-binding protein